MTDSSTPTQPVANPADTDEMLGYEYDVNRLMLAEDTPNGLELGNSATVRKETQNSEGTLFKDESAYANKIGLANSGLTLEGAQYIPDDGFFAACYATPDGKLIIGFQGSIFGSTLYDQSSEAADTDLVNHVIPAALVDAENFTTAVIANAKLANILAPDIYVTGMSLGGAEAEYAAMNSNLAGVAFAGTGLPGYVPAVAPVADFTDYVEYGDPVANFASDTSVKAVLTPTNMDHYGTVVMLGDQTAGSTLSNMVDANPSALAMLNSPMMHYHNLNLYAADLHLVTAGS